MRFFHRPTDILDIRQIQRKSFTVVVLAALLTPISVPVPVIAATGFESGTNGNDKHLAKYLKNVVTKVESYENHITGAIADMSDKIANAFAAENEPGLEPSGSEEVKPVVETKTVEPKRTNHIANLSILNQLPEDERESIYSPENNLGSPVGQSTMDVPWTTAPLPIKHRPGAANYSFSIPLASLPGRGIDAGIGLTYNSRTWNKSSAYDPNTQTSTDHYTYDVDESWIAPGFSSGFGQIMSHLSARTIVIDVDGDLLNRTLTEVIPDGIVDPDGTRHQISCTGWTSIPSSTYTRCSQYETSDGSLVKISRSAGHSIETYIDYGLYDDATFTAYYPNGMQKNFTKPFGSGTSRRHYPYLIEDSNGNRIRANYRTEQSGSISQIFDTLNREIKFYYEPGTGGARERLITIAIPGMGTNDEIQTVRFYYDDLTLNTTGKFDGDITAPASIRVLKWVYFPATKTAYKYYYHSNYGMITKIERRVGVTVSDPTSTTVTGTVTSEGVVAASTEYTYPDGSTMLTDVPNYASRVDDWAGRGGGSAPETLYGTGTVVSTGEKTSSVTVDDGGTAIEYRTTFYNTPAWKAGLTKSMETISGSTVLAKTEYFWTAGPLQYGHTNPQLTKIETTDLTLTKATEFEYDGYNNQTKIKEYDYAAPGSLGDLLKTTEIAYETGSGWINQRLYSLPKSIKTVVNSVTVNKTLLEYDKNGNDSGITKYTDINTDTHNRNFDPNHPAWMEEICPLDDPETESALPGGCVVRYHPGYTSANAYRGNLTKITRFSDATLTTDPNADVTEYSYDMTGNVVSATLSCCNMKAISYGGSWSATGYAYPVTETKGVGSMQLESSAVYNFNTGLVTSTEDANGQVTDYEYETDTLRPKKTTYPNDAYTETEYSDKLVSNPADLLPGFVRTTTTLDANKYSQSYTYVNGRGQTIRSAAETPDGWSIGAVEYDDLGRPRKTYNPFYGSTPVAAVPGGTAYSAVTDRDLIGRTTEVTLQDGTKVETAYGYGSDFTYVTVTDQAGKQRRQVADALGRVVRVDEPDAGGALGTVTSPAQPTYYEYDGNDNLVKVTQSDGTTTQERKFLYDSLSRLIAERQVEADPTLSLDGTKGTADPSKWTKVLKYDADGLLEWGVDARGVKTAFAYDGLNRVASVTYTGESGYQTPNVTYTYDQASTGMYNLGALTRVETAATDYAPATATEFDYDKMGRVVKHRQYIGTNEFAMEYGYNLAGQLVTEKYPSGKVVATSYDDNGRLDTVADQNRTYLSGITYGNLGGGISEIALGNGTTETYTLNSRMQMTSQSLAKGTNVLQKYDYGYGQLNQYGTRDLTKNNGQLAEVKSYIGTTQQWTQKFTYDSIGRLSETKEFRGSTSFLSYKQTFDFDRFGNMYRKAANNGTSGQETPIPYTPIEDSDISKQTNRFTSDTTYDEAGNVIADAKFRSMSFGYDANGRMVKSTKTSQPDANSVYDAAGMRVAECVNNVWRLLVYDVGGKLIAEYGGPETSGAGGLSYVMQDWQGSTRVVTNAHGFVKSRNDYTAFGEDIASGTGLRTENQGFGSSDSLRQKYGLTERDDATGLDHTWFRKHETQAGRWTSPDPYNGSMNIGDPQSFNRYSYVQNEPTNYIDPSGLVIIAVRRCTSVDEDGPTWEDDETIHIGVESHTVCTWEFIDFGGGGFDYGFEDYPGNFDPNFGGGGVSMGDCDEMVPANKPPDASVRSNIATTETTVSQLDTAAQAAARDISSRGTPLNVAAAEAISVGAKGVDGAVDKWFYGMVAAGNEWDYKRNDNGEYEDFGNFNYGAVGAAAGYSSAVLERMAGWVQAPGTGTGEKSPSMLSARAGVGGKWPFGDEVKDNIMIKLGIAYYNCIKGEQ